MTILPGFPLMRTRLRSLPPLCLAVLCLVAIYSGPNRRTPADQPAPKDKLPPSTPGLTVLVRANWRTPAAFTTNVMTGF